MCQTFVLCHFHYYRTLLRAFRAFLAYLCVFGHNWTTTHSRDISDFFLSSLPTCMYLNDNHQSFLSKDSSTGYDLKHLTTLIENKYLDFFSVKSMVKFIPASKTSQWYINFLWKYCWARNPALLFHFYFTFIS